MDKNDTPHDDAERHEVDSGWGDIWQIAFVVIHGQRHQFLPLGYGECICADMHDDA